MKKQAIDKKYIKIGRQRVIIENVTPAVDGGLYPVKRTIGESLVVEADVFADGHDHVTPVLMHRTVGSKKWTDAAMKSIENDRWRATIQLNTTGKIEYSIRAFINHAETWIFDFRLRVDPKELQLQLKIGIEFLHAIQAHYPKKKVAAQKWIDLLSGNDGLASAASVELETFLAEHPLDQFETTHANIQTCIIDRKRAGFSAWYSFFPRSSAPANSSHGTFSDCEKLLPRIKEMGFDVVYLPPIHPIGHAFRKGKNNSLDIQPDEPGCPYATGNENGGHKSVLSDLGTLADFIKFVKAAESLGMEVAMDFAIQCSPDHPYVMEHPQWFKWRPDGTVQYAENPPKKYQDVLPLDYENDDWQNMWLELKSILEFWIEKGIQIFRVDNPHTKSFVFWEWCVAEIYRTNPDVIFLSEAFTRPRVMENLAKKGYHQSYSYFTWRNNKHELTQYMDELTRGNMREYFRPNFWPNTHDINPYILQSGHEPQYIIRFFLAAALSSNYGIYGPCFELLDHAALPGKEEYLDSEKYEVRHWDWNKRNKLMKIISLVNAARNENEAMQFTNNYRACEVNNDQLIAWTKVHGDSKIICVVNLDAYARQSGMLKISSEQLALAANKNFTVHDLITGEKYSWSAGENFVDLDPNKLPFHLFRVES